jgi:hypothetical protein
LMTLSSDILSTWPIHLNLTHKQPSLRLFVIFRSVTKDQMSQRSTSLVTGSFAFLVYTQSKVGLKLITTARMMELFILSPSSGLKSWRLRQYGNMDRALVIQGIYYVSPETL